MKNLIVIILFYFNISFLFAQQSWILQRQTPDISEYPTTAFETTDSTIFIASTNLISGVYYPTLYKVNNNGNIIDSVSISTAITGKIRSIYKIQANQYVGIGMVKSDTSNFYDLWYFNFDNNLIITNQKRYHTNYYSSFYTFSLLDSKNNLIITGTGTDNANEEGIFYAKIDIDGTLIDSIKYVNYIGYDFSYNFIENSNNTYFTFIYSEYLQYSLIHKPTAVITLDSVLNVINIEAVPLHLDNQLTAKRKNNHEYYLSGNWINVENNENYPDLGIMLIDSMNNLLRFNHFGKQDTTDHNAVSKSMDFINYNNIYLAGTLDFYGIGYPYPQHTSWVGIYKVDSLLDLKWQKLIGGDAFYETISTHATSDGGCLILAYRYDHLIQNYERDLFIIKVDSNGNILSSIPETVKEFSNYLLYPNPGVNSVNVLCPESFHQLEIDFFNTFGTLCKKEIINENAYQINTIDLPSGIYFYRIIQNNKTVATGKWIKE